MNKKELLMKGLKTGIPICMGYFAVAITFGLQAGMGGLGVIETTLISLTNLTSAGQFGGLEVIINQGSYLELALSQLILNLRYILMSISLSQKIDQEASLFQRLIISHGITDEIFGVSMMEEGKLSPYFSYGVILISTLGWVGGTFVGVSLGNILPMHLLNALGIAIYGMFLAVIIPSAKKNRTLLLVIIVSMLVSGLFEVLPLLNQISSGFKIIIVTIIIAGVFAYKYPVKEG